MKTKKSKQHFDSVFQKEIYEGLTAFPKYISSKWFYDKKGDQLFQQIMSLSEYYLTGCEYEILDTHTAEIAQLFSDDQGFDLVELGAGDGKKTKVLLKHLVQNKIPFTYKPIDISQNALDGLEQDLVNAFPELDMVTEQGTYFEVLENLCKRSSERKTVIMVLGSNIGNLNHENAIKFLSDIRKCMNPKDLLFMGFDQKKDPSIILNAYNDSQGVTEAFNKNVLKRINTILGADFDPDCFKHWPTYDPETGTTKSFLVSTKDQKVSLNKLNLEISFSPWESIHTEISQKYDDHIVDWLAQEAGLKVTVQFQDSKEYFTDYVFKKV